MRSTWFRVVFVCSLVLAATGFAPASAAETAPPSWPPTELTVGIQTRSSETEGMGDVLVPLWTPGRDGLLFLNPRSSVSDHSAEDYNLGVGYRHLLAERGVILGANAFYDYRDSRAGSFNQWGAGVELLSDWVDARANVYDADGKRRLVASETQTTTRRSVRTAAEDWGNPYATGHRIVQDYTLARRVTTETFGRTYEQFQRAMGGFDFELGFRLPVPVDGLEARVFGGYYNRDGEYGEDVRGWKARAELRLASTLFLDAGAYENDDLTGSDWFVGARLNLPLDFADLSRGRGLFSTARSRLNRDPRDLSARLTEMVMRDPQIRVETSPFIENTALATHDVARRTARERRTLTLLPDVMFVHGDLGSSNGSAENPYRTIQQAVDSVFGARNVYVFGASRAYEENVVLQPGVTLWGSGSAIPGMGGKSFGSGIAPVVDGMSLGPAVTMADRTTVRGMHVRNSDMGAPPIWVETFGEAFVDVSRAGIYGADATDLVIRDNLIAGNSAGVFLQRQGSFDLLFSGNRVQNNENSGLLIDALGNGGFGLGSKQAPHPLLDELSTFFVSIQDSQFANNGYYGAEIYASNYDFAFTLLRDCAFSNNEWDGAFVYHVDSTLSLVAASGIAAHQNGWSGLYVDQSYNLAALANLSGIAAHQNGEYGIALTQTENRLSLGLLGMPANDLAGAAGNLIGLELPFEFASFLQAAGPIAASGNDWDGVNARVSGDMLALGLFFDVAANDNGMAGLNALVESDSGYAIGLAGSSRNVAEVLQLGVNLIGAFGLDLPVEFSSDGQMQANNNAHGGIVLTADGGEGAFSALLGAQVAHNNGIGATVVAHGESFAISAAARIEAAGNAQHGLGLAALAEGLALGLIADVHSSNNLGAGIAANVESERIAALLTLSTDAIRPLAALLGEQFLGEPIAIPGAPFGPNVLQNNHGQGLLANVSGDTLAAALFLDTHAIDNWNNGFEVDVSATNGNAIAAFLSSDLLYEILPVLMGGDPIPGPGLGGIVASDNVPGSGIELNVAGYDQAVALLAGVDASGNIGAGIQASLFAVDGNAMAYLVAVDANDNLLGPGIDLTLTSLFYGDVLAGLVDVSANNNGDSGILLAATSLEGSAFALLAGVDASFNAGHGIGIGMVASEDAAAALTDVRANLNFDDDETNGVAVQLVAGEDAFLFAGQLAAADLDDVYGYFDVMGPLGQFILPGAVDFSGNQGDGLFATLTAGGDATVAIVDAVADLNGSYGMHVHVEAGGDVYAYFSEIEANGNGKDGIRLEAIGGGDVYALFSDVLASANDGRGVDVFALTDGNVYLGMADVAAGFNQFNNVDIHAQSLDGDVYALFSGIDAHGSEEGHGISVNLAADGQVAVALAAVDARFNHGRGAEFAFTAGGDAVIFAGNDVFGSFMDEFGSPLDDSPIADLFLAGESTFNHNGLDGFWADVTSLNGDAVVVVDGATANANSTRGFNLMLNAIHGDAQAYVGNATANNNDDHGIRLTLAGVGGTAGAWFEHVQTTNNSGSGIAIIETYNGTVEIGGERIVSAHNALNGIDLVLSGLDGAPVVDFGGGALDGAGQNSFYGNATDMRYNNGGLATVMAQHNWWGPGGGTIAGTIDRSNPLAADPNLP